MKLAITYAELQDYLASHIHKTVNLGYVDGATVSVIGIEMSLAY